MNDESSDRPTRPTARPKAKPRYQPEAPPARPAPVRSAKTEAEATRSESARPAKVEPSKPAEPAEPKPAATTAQPRRRADLRRLRRPATIYSALVAAAAVFAGYALVAWLTAGHDDTAHFAKARDTVLLDARQDIVVLNTLDYRRIDDGLKRWLAASTGNLHEQIANVTPSDKKDLVNAKKVSSGKVIDAAVTQLDNRAGNATVIATVETTVSPSNGAPPKRNRFSATLARDGGSWKLSDLQQVAVNLS
jgi:Mce-associated membrane protein